MGVDPGGDLDQGMPLVMVMVQVPSWTSVWWRGQTRARLAMSMRAAGGPRGGVVDVAVVAGHQAAGDGAAAVAGGHVLARIDSAADAATAEEEQG